MIDVNYFWICILLLAFGTYLIRSSIIMMSSRIQFSERAKVAFSFIPAAILPAIAWPMVFSHTGHVAWLFGKERFAVLILASVVAYLSQKMTLTLVVGLTALYVLSQF